MAQDFEIQRVGHMTLVDVFLTFMSKLYRRRGGRRDIDMRVQHIEYQSREICRHLGNLAKNSDLFDKLAQHQKAKINRT